MDTEHKTAVVTGASSGIGAEIAGLLCREGITVYGIGRNFTGKEPESSLFHRTVLDLREPERIQAFARQLRERGVRVDMLVNGAGVAYYGLHENLRPEQICDMVRVNAEAPMLLTALFLKDLRERRGTILNLSSVTAKSGANTHGAAYGATKAALTSFGSSLFEEVRKHGVRVCTVHPDLTDTALYRHADFGVNRDPAYSLTAKEIAEAAVQCLFAREGMAFTDITVRPSRNGIVRKKNSPE